MSSVKVYVYDLSQGLAKALSSQLLGQHVDGIWHTGIVVYGKEHFFGSGGIETCPPGGTVLGNPQQIVDLGVTEVPEELFYGYLDELGEQGFRPEKYHLFDHNCNTFSDEVAFFLTNKRVPSHITDLPRSIATTPIGQMVRSFVDKMSAPSASSTHFQVSAAHGPARPKPKSPTPRSKSTSPTPRSNSKSPSPKDTSRGRSPSPDLSSFGEPVLIEALLNTLIPNQPPPKPRSKTSLRKRDKSRETGSSLTKDEATEEQRSKFDNNSASSCMRGLFEFATATEEPKWGLGPKHFALLGKDLRKLEEEEQVLILSLFRVSLCRSTDVAMGLLHDRGRNFLTLLEEGEEDSTVVTIGLLQMACNFVSKLGQAKESLPEPFRPPLVQLALRGLDEGQEKLLPATQLAFNLTAVHAVQDDALLTLGSILIYVLSCADASAPSPAHRHAVKALLNLCRLNDDIRQLAVVQGLDASNLAGEDGERLQAILHGNL